MGIISGASPGVQVQTAAMDETLGNQSQQTNSNTVVVSDDIGTLGNGQLVGSPTYDDRLCIIRQGQGDEETRYILSTASGTGNTEILTVSEDWNTVPADSDTIHVSYIIQDVATVTGLSLVNKTVQDYASSRRLQVGNNAVFAFLAFINGVGLQSDDNGSTTVASITIDVDGRFDCGYLQGGVPTSGCKIQFANGSDGELAIEIISGGEFNCFASYIDGVNRELVDFNTSTTSKIRMNGVRWSFPINDILWGVQDTDLNNVAFLSDGGGTTPRIDIRDISSGNEMKNIVVNSFDGFESNTTGDDPVLRNIQLVRMTKLYTIATAETWIIVNSIHPTISTADQNDVSIAGTGELIRKFEFRNLSHDLSDVALTAKVYVVNAVTRGGAGTLVHEDTADSGGEIRQDVEVERYVDDSGTALTLTSSSNFAEISSKYGFLPIIKNVEPANEDETSSPTKYGKAIDYAHSVDIYQVESDAGVARTAGDSINTVQIEKQTNPATLFKFTGGSGTDPSLGDTIGNNQNSAEGVFIALVEGDFVAGTMLLDTRDSTAWDSGVHVVDDGASSGDWTADFDDSFGFKEFTWLIDIWDLTTQNLYDYLNAKLDESTLDVASPTFFDDILIWAIDGTNALPMVGTQSVSPKDFKTVREAGKSEGWMVYDSTNSTGAAQLGGWTEFTSDDGTVFIPAATVLLSIHCERKDDNSNIDDVQIIIQLVSDGSTVASGTTNASGNLAFNFTYFSDVDVTIKARKSTLPIPRFFAELAANTIKTTGMTQNFLMTEDEIVAQV